MWRHARCASAAFSVQRIPVRVRRVKKTYYVHRQVVKIVSSIADHIGFVVIASQRCLFVFQLKAQRAKEILHPPARYAGAILVGARQVFITVAKMFPVQLYPAPCIFYLTLQVGILLQPELFRSLPR